MLVLARASHLPTVWSNCLAAWWLGGGGSLWALAALLAAATLIYSGGMFMNDAADTAFDRQHRRGRPIPSGQIREGLVWQLSAGFMAAGALLMLGLGLATSANR